jgi:glycosyltransferase involved in cell wall biosynthesis
MATKLIIDCQILQTSDRNRGMGLFLYSLLDALSDAEHNLDLTLLINSRLSRLSTSDTELLKALGTIVEAGLLIQKDHEYYAQASEHNRQVIDTLNLSSGSSNQTAFFIPALFSSEIYPVYPSYGTTNMLLFHDIIPYLYPDQYFSDPEGHARKDYAQRWREAYKTDLYITNSQTTADDLTIYFGIDPSRIVPVLGAGAHFENSAPVKPNIAAASGKYILMPSGDDARKNNELAVRAFADQKTDAKLIITSNFSEPTKRKLQSISPRLIFSGSVSGDELLWLIDNALFILFPTEYEGLGMPILEAVNRNATIACSNIPVFKEISSDAFYYFNPTSQLSIAKTIKQLLESSEKSKDHKKKYQSIENKFNWQKSASRFIKAIDSIEPAPTKKSLAVFCPSPSSYSAVGKYVFEVHGELSRYFDIDYYYENGQTEFKQTRPNILEYAANYYPVADFDFKGNKYDHVLYHIGNSEFHAETILSSLRYPANAIIHDSWLNGIFDFLERYKYLTGSRHQLELLLDKKLDSKKSSRLASIATNQKAVFCHSGYVKDAVTEISNKIKVKQLPLAVGVPVIKSSQISSQTVPTISFAGIISEAKGINLLADIAALKNVKVKVFGYSVLGTGPMLDGLGSNVKFLENLSDKRFQDELADTDILINYRVNYHGESSKSTLEAMRYGAAVVVKDVGWFGELPDDTVVKVDNEIDLRETVKALIRDDQRRVAIGDSARHFLSSKYSYSKYAKQLAESLEDN